MIHDALFACVMISFLLLKKVHWIQSSLNSLLENEFRTNFFPEFFSVSKHFATEIFKA